MDLVKVPEKLDTSVSSVKDAFDAVNLPWYAPESRFWASHTFPRSAELTEGPTVNCRVGSRHLATGYDPCVRSRRCFR
jgi:hypothetical protein